MKIALLCMSGAMLWCNGCIVGFKPASDTILRFEPADASQPAKPTTVGIRDVYFDKLDHGYGVAGDSSRQRDHEAYFYFGYDPDMGNNRPSWVLITPLEWKGRGQATAYRLEILRQNSLFVATIGPPSRASKTRVQFDLRKVPVTLTAGFAIFPLEHEKPVAVVVSGRIVAEKTKAESFESFESKLTDWNQVKREVH